MIVCGYSFGAVLLPTPTGFSSRIRLAELSETRLASVRLNRTVTLCFWGIKRRFVPFLRMSRCTTTEAQFLQLRARYASSSLLSLRATQTHKLICQLWYFDFDVWRHVAAIEKEVCLVIVAWSAVVISNPAVCRHTEKCWQSVICWSM